MNGRLILVSISLIGTIQANFFTDAWDGITHAANKVQDAFNTAGQEIGKAANTVGSEIAKRFQDTQTTRAIDFGIQIAALETAKAATKLAYETAKGTSLVSIRLGKETTMKSLEAAQGILDKVGKPLSSAALQGAREAAHNVLEFSKIASVGTLDASQWVASNVLNQFDINEIVFQGSLEALKQGSFGKTHIRGTLFNKDFSGDVDLSVKSAEDVLNSCKPYIDNAINEIKKFFNDLDSKMSALFTQQASIDNARQALQVQTQGTNLTTVIAQAETALKARDDVNTATAKLESTIQGTVRETEKKLNEFAQKTSNDLKDIISRQATGAESAQARQELTRRLR